MSKLQKILMSICVLGMIMFMGCSMFQDIITPAYVNKNAAEWANEPVKLLNPFYSSLWDARRVAMAIDYKLTIERIKGGYYKNITNLSILAGEELKDTVFAPDGLLSLLLVGGPTFAMGSLLISKPKDKKIIEGLKNGNK